MCKECSKPCDWSCDHYTCSKTCSEQCDRQPCDEPCNKKLPCKHACLGYCGEPCPKACLQCDSRLFRRMERYSKKKFSANNRFILLQPCGHIVEALYLKNYIEKLNQRNVSGLHSISPLLCPHCDEVVLICPRYGDVIKNYIKVVNDVRKRIRRQTIAAFVSMEHSLLYFFFKLIAKNHVLRRFTQNVLCSLRILQKLNILDNHMTERRDLLG